jgi:hypothetical protein
MGDYCRGLTAHVIHSTLELQENERNGAEKCQFRTEKCQFRTEKCQCQFNGVFLSPALPQMEGRAQHATEGAVVVGRLWLSVKGYIWYGIV